MTTIKRHAHKATSAGRVAAAFLALTSAFALTGCAANDADLARWETTLGGPKRLSAVVLFDKYPRSLRVQAAMSLVNMKPRKGKHIGIERLIKGTLVCDPLFVRSGEACNKTELSPNARAAILADLVPLIIEQLGKEPPPPAQKGQVAPDPSFKFKDAAYLMLSYEKTQVIADQALRKQLSAALTSWAMTDFERRLNDKNQAFGMEQLLRHIGPSSVAGLPQQMTKNSRNLAKMADLVAKIADKDTREAASTRLVDIVKHVSSEAWRKEKLPDLKEANRKAGFDPTDKQLGKQLADFQNESVTRVYASMKKVGGSAVVSYCLEVAANKKVAKKRRQTALAALEGHIDRKNTKQIDDLFAIAKSDAPPEVVDQAFRRIRELPRDKAVGKLYGFFESENWKLRRLAAATVLQMSTVKHIDEFLEQLGAKAEKNFNLPEAITYGAYLAALKEGDVLAALKPHMAKGPVQARMAALSYYYELGDNKTLGAIGPFENDTQKAPTCDDDAGCDWTCLVGPGEKKKTAKDVKTVGDFVQYCIKPKMSRTDPADSKKKKENGSAKKGKSQGEQGSDKKDK